MSFPWPEEACNSQIRESKRHAKQNFNYIPNS
jgi:hypothetical protein